MHIKKSALLVLLLMLWSLLAGCGTYQTYDELDVESRRTGDTTKIDKREAQFEKARVFFENKAACLKSDDHVWVCTKMQGGRLRDRPDREVSIDGTVKRWRRERNNFCGCAQRSDIFSAF